MSAVPPVVRALLPALLAGRSEAEGIGQAHPVRALDLGEKEQIRALVLVDNVERGRVVHLAVV
jgi:hypothetical protein